jgi:hypothetical protein
MADNVVKSLKGLNVSGDLFDLMMAGVVKYFTERALIKYVGNANYTSGATKLGIGVALDMFGSKLGRAGKVVKSAMVLDGVEDVTQATIQLIMGKKNSSNEIQTI